jgi:hypothetical protein
LYHHSSTSYPDRIDALFDRLDTLHSQKQSDPTTVSADPIDYLDFSQSGNSAPCRLFGWDNPENDFTWTIGTEAYLLVSTPQNHTPLFLNVRLDSFRYDSLFEQPVIIQANDTEIARWSVKAFGHYFALIPARFCTGGELQLRFSIPEACSPREVGAADDDRQLGLRFEALWMSPADGVPV